MRCTSDICGKSDDELSTALCVLCCCFVRSDIQKVFPAECLEYAAGLGPGLMSEELIVNKHTAFTYGQHRTIGGFLYMRLFKVRPKGF